MNIEIQEKIITKTANNIGVAVTFIDYNLAQCNWSLNDEHGNSIDSGIDLFNGLTVSDVMQKLFIKLDIKTP